MAGVGRKLLRALDRVCPFRELAFRQQFRDVEGAEINVREDVGSRPWFRSESCCVLAGTVGNCRELMLKGVTEELGGVNISNSHV